MVPHTGYLLDPMCFGFILFLFIFLSSILNVYYSGGIFTVLLLHPDKLLGLEAPYSLIPFCIRSSQGFFSIRPVIFHLSWNSISVHAV